MNVTFLFIRLIKMTKMMRLFLFFTLTSYFGQ